MIKKITFLFMLLMSVAFHRTQAQELAFRTSVTMLATATANLEVSTPVSKHWTVHLPVLYNPWVFGENSRLQQLTTMPGVRWWKQQANVHYFVSAYGIASRYHVGGFFNSEYRYNGKAFGVGIGGGYSFVLSKHWNIEAELGFGYVYADYDKCGWNKYSHFYGRHKEWKFVPTKIDVSFVYFY